MMRLSFDQSTNVGGQNFAAWTGAPHRIDVDTGFLGQTPRFG
jgi:hypothetical protein